jgi:hypothetical protein
MEGAPPYLPPGVPPGMPMMPHGMPMMPVRASAHRFRPAVVLMCLSCFCSHTWPDQATWTVSRASEPASGLVP